MKNRATSSEKKNDYFWACFFGERDRAATSGRALWGEGLGEDGEGAVNLVGVDDEGGDEAQDVFTRGDAEESVFAGFGFVGFGGGVEFQANHEPFAAHSGDEGIGGGKAAQAIHQARAHLVGVGEQVFFFDGFKGGEGHRTGERGAPEGAGVIAGLEDIGKFRGDGGSANREAAAQRLGHGDAIGADAEMLIAKPLAGAADTGLDFIEEQQQVFGGAQLAQASQEFGGGGQDAAFALNGLAEDRDGGGGDGGTDGVEVIELGIDKPGHEGSKPILIFGLAGGGHGGEGSAMKGVFHRDDFVAAGGGAPLAGELDEAFVGFGA